MKDLHRVERMRVFSGRVMWNATELGLEFCEVVVGCILCFLLSCEFPYSLLMLCV